MRSQHTVIEIMPSAVAARVIRHGRVAAHAEEPIDRSDWGDSWTLASDSIRVALEKVVAQLALRGRSATIVYALPGTACVVTPAAPNMSHSRALESACLAAQSALGESHVEDVSAGCLLHRAPESAGGVAHYLACAADVRSLDTLTKIVESVGLAVHAMVPREACAIVEAVALGKTSGERPRVVAWVGRHDVAIAITRDDRLLTVRTVGIGLAALVDALIRAPSKDSVSTSPPRTRAQAWEALWNAGIPGPSPATPGNATSSGSGVLPALQPVLQRLAIEIKQSLRFEIEAGVREEAILSIVGPGRFCPGLLDILGRFVGLEVAPPEPDVTSKAFGMSFAVASPNLRVPALLPPRLAHARIIKRVRVGLAAGCALALALTAQSRVSSMQELRQDRAKLESLAPQLAQAVSTAQQEHQVLQSQSQVAQARGWLHKQVAEGPSAAAVLQLLASVETAEIRLRSIDITSNTTGTPQLILFAVAPAEGEVAAESIHRYVSAIEQSSLVSSAKLGAAQRIELEGRPMQSFNLTVELVSLPSAARVAQMEAHQ